MVVKNAIHEGGAIIRLQNRARVVEQLRWVKLDIQSCARRLYIKASTVSDLQNLQPCQTGWGMKSMASGRSGSNHMHLKVNTPIDLAGCMLGSCYPLAKTSVYNIWHFFILCSTSSLQSSSVSANLFPLLTCSIAASYLWVGTGPTAWWKWSRFKWRHERYPQHHPLTAIKQVEGRVSTSVFYKTWKQRKVWTKDERLEREISINERFCCP